MITVVNEPQAEYKVAGWRTESKVFSFDDFICGIENETVLFYPPSGSTFIMLSEKPKRKLSALRGKMTNQSEKEIDDQISDLRSEWDRNI
jgi:hypothetical protein